MSSGAAAFRIPGSASLRRMLANSESAPAAVAALLLSDDGSAASGEGGSAVLAGRGAGDRIGAAVLGGVRDAPATAGRCSVVATSSATTAAGTETATISARKPAVMTAMRRMLVPRILTI